MTNMEVHSLSTYYLVAILKLNKIRSLLCVALNRNYHEIRSDNAANWFAFA